MVGTCPVLKGLRRSSNGALIISLIRYQFCSINKNNNSVLDWKYQFLIPLHFEDYYNFNIPIIVSNIVLYFISFRNILISKNICCHYLAHNVIFSIRYQGYSMRTPWALILLTLIGLFVIYTDLLYKYYQSYLNYV